MEEVDLKDLEFAAKSRKEKFKIKLKEWLAQRTYRDVVLFIGIAINLVAGTQYNFSAYSPTLRKQENFSSTETTMIATLGNLGLYCGFLIGILYDKGGPRITAAVSGVLVFFGYGMAWLALQFDFAYAWLLAIFYIFVGQGCWGLYEVALLTNMKNFKGPHIGVITGILASAFGLSSGLFTLIWSGFFSPDDNVKGFILLMAICVTTMSVVAVFTVKIVNKEEAGEKREEGDIDEKKGIMETAQTPEESKQIVLQQEVDVTGKELAMQFDFWLLWLAFLIGAGIGLMMINHLGDLVISLDGTSTEKNMLVGLLSLCNCIGRIGIGFASDKFKDRINKAYWLVMAFLILAASHFVFFFTTSFWYVPILVATTAFSYGSMFAVVPVLIPQYWGFKHMGINYGFVALAPAVGSIFYGQIASFLYDYYKDDGDDSCYGSSCYEVAFALTASTSLIGAALSFVLVRRRIAYERRYTVVTAPQS